MPESIPLSLENPVALLWIVLGVLCLVVIVLIWIIAQLRRSADLHDPLVRIETRVADQIALISTLEQHIGNIQHTNVEDALRLREAIRVTLGDQFARQLQHHGESQQGLQETLRVGMTAVQQQVLDALGRNARTINEQVETLTKVTDRRLQEIGGQVDKRLSEGFEKTTATFADVLKRLALIDEAQKKITELSSNVVSLQEVLSDKRSRGAYGEIQLASLVRNVLPEQSFALQHRLSNDRIADCVLFLPEPTGHIALDSKFPLESYRAMTDFDASEHERKQAHRQFKQDIRKHIQNIAERYILPNETADGAVMFIPAEAVFAEIQAHHPDLVELAHKRHVWLVSPTTLWAVLNTARSVLKDAAFREQVDVIREHLALLAQDFDRFQDRMEALSRHIEQAHRDVQNVNTSARKITDRFGRIERVELEPSEQSPIEIEKSD